MSTWFGRVDIPRRQVRARRRGPGRGARGGAPTTEGGGGAAGRVVIVSASLGAGHDGVALELAARLRARGYRVVCADFLGVLPLGVGWLLRGAYRRQLAIAPTSWGWLLGVLDHARGAGLAVWLTRWGARAMLRLLDPGVDVVVSTYPLAGQLITALKREGRVRVPLVTYLTDVSVHRLWVAAGTDEYLATHPGAVAQARRLGARPVALATAVVRPGFRPAADSAERSQARASFGLPPAGRLALLLCGAWGVGEVAASATEIARSGVAVPVVVCARNTALRARLASLRPAVVLAWVTDMPTLMRACDVAVVNSGGLSYSEAVASGLPVISYRALPGHGTANARVLAESGSAPWANSPEELLTLLRTAIDTAHATCRETARTPAELKRVDPVEAITQAASQHRTAITAAETTGARPGARTRRRLVSVTAIGWLLWMMTTGTSIAVAHGFRAIRSSNPTQVFLVVELDPDQPLTPAIQTALQGLHAGLGLSARTIAEHPTLVHSLAATDLTVINSAGGRPYETGLIDVDGRRAIGATAHALTALGMPSPTMLLSNGDVDALDVGLAALHAERFVVPHTLITCGAPLPPLRAGVVLLQPPPHGTCALSKTLEQVTAALAARGLHPSAWAN